MSNRNSKSGLRESELPVNMEATRDYCGIHGDIDGLAGSSPRKPKVTGSNPRGDKNVCYYGLDRFFSKILNHVVGNAFVIDNVKKT